MMKIKIHEPMLRHSVVIHIGEEGAKEYEKITGHKINIESQDGACYSEPVKFCYHLWIDKQDNYGTLIHEFYHLVSQVRELMDFCEETGAYYIGFLFRTYLDNIK